MTDRDKNLDSNLGSVMRKTVVLMTHPRLTAWKGFEPNTLHSNQTTPLNQKAFNNYSSQVSGSYRS